MIYVGIWVSNFEKCKSITYLSLINDHLI